MMKPLSLPIASLITTLSFPVMSFPLVSTENPLLTACVWENYVADKFNDCLALASQDNAAAQFTIGQAYLKGSGVEKSQTDAEEWITKSARHGYKDAEYFLGILSESRFAQGEETDLIRAKEWFSKAAEHGHAEAPYSLALLLLDGKGGLTKNIDEAVKLLAKSANSGNTEAAMYLYRIYRKGEDVTKNNDEAIKWLKKAAELGSLEAETELAGIYLYGRNETAKNIPEAIKWLTILADKGIVEAQVSLGLLYSDGKEVEKKITDTVKWWSKVTEHNRSEEICNITYHPKNYFNTDVDLDTVKAFEWCKEQAEIGNTSAQFALALLYKHSKAGLKKDDVTAYKWMLLSANAGNEIAKEWLKRWANFSDKNKKKATELVKKWKAKPVPVVAPPAPVAPAPVPATPAPEAPVSTPVKK